MYGKHTYILKLGHTEPTNQRFDAFTARQAQLQPNGGGLWPEISAHTFRRMEEGSGQSFSCFRPLSCCAAMHGPLSATAETLVAHALFVVSWSLPMVAWQGWWGGAWIPGVWWQMRVNTPQLWGFFYFLISALRRSQWAGRFHVTVLRERGEKSWPDEAVWASGRLGPWTA
jgi:hypothetical protein